MKLNQKFNFNDFSEWVDNFLPAFKSDIRNVDIPKGFKNIISIKTIGDCDLNLRVFVIETETDPSNRKVSLAKDSFNLIKNYGTPNALIAYYSINSQNWRISLLTSTPIWSDGKVISKLSNPRRHSYILGEKAKTATPQRFLLSKGKVSNFKDLKERFSLEVVNKEFYEQISQAFNILVGGKKKYKRRLIEYEPLLKLPIDSSDHQKYSEFAVRLIGRIIFCWFLKEKKSSNNLSLMPEQLLSSGSAITEDYYHAVLEPIFFEILNKPVKNRKEEFSKLPFSQIPYLNGGLFSPQEYDFYNYIESRQIDNKRKTVIPNIWFVNLFETLETYNFTIDENTSFDEELSIDPEMLGRIFENLLAEINPETGETARKNTGSYYTPRVVVDYMIDESLLAYLKEKTNINEDKLKASISYDLEDDISYPLNDYEKQEIVNALSTIKILDPACGSGAFPIGVLQKIVFILQLIDPSGQNWFKKQIENTPNELKKILEREFKEKNFDYLRKLGVIKENIYGVDIQPIATEISRLRCFLTLIVDERIEDNSENRGIEPLPNLDFKFVTANTLISLPDTAEDNPQVGLFEDSQGIEELKEIRNQFFNASGFERDHLKLQFAQIQNKMLNKLIKENRRGFADLTSKLTSWDPFTHKNSDWFDSEWMFGIKDGFDIVIANPPYISFGIRGMQKMTTQERNKVVKAYPNSAEYKISFYAIFMDKAIQLSKKELGIQTYIVPDSFLLGRYFSKIRKYILQQCEIIHISWMPYKIFDATVGFSTVYTFKRGLKINSSHEVKVRKITNNSEILEKSYIEFKYPQGYFNLQKYNRFRIFFDDSTKKLVDKIERNSVYLGDYFTGRTGIRSLIGQKNIISKQKEGDNWQKGIISGGQILKYKIIYNGDYINVDPKILNKGGWDYNVIHNPKILIRQTSDSLTASIDKENYYHLNNVHSFSPKNNQNNLKLEYILAVINSKLLTWFYQTTTLETGRAMAQTDIDILELLPIKLIPIEIQETYVTLTNELLKKNSEISNPKNDEIKQILDKIDQMIYKLYGLDENEINIIEKYYSK